jgi:hypothetical protein
VAPGQTAQNFSSNHGGSAEHLAQQQALLNDEFLAQPSTQPISFPLEVYQEKIQEEETKDELEGSSSTLTKPPSNQSSKP